MKRIAKFEKVSFEQFKKDFQKNFNVNDEEVKEIYDNIKLPVRATKASAGYDFFAPVDLELKQGVSNLVPTGIRAKIDDEWVLKIYPRSGLGFKHRIQLDNTVGIIDSDYYGSSNEGHIMIKVTCDSKENEHICKVEQGQGFAQGIFLEYGITVDDNVCEVRDGGFGSTTK